MLTPIDFKLTICNTFGSRGELWLQELPKIISTLKKDWNLSEIEPVQNMTYHYVAKAICPPNQPVVIKIGCDEALSSNEAKFLQEFKSGGMIRLLDFNKQNNALLLEQARPGHPLKSLYPDKLNFVMNAYANIIKTLSQHPFSRTTPFPPISSWLTALDKVKANEVDHYLLKTAIIKRDQLLASVNHLCLLHGDLHLDNILANQEEWVCIDPKGIIGEIEFEIAAFDIFAPSEFQYATTKEFLSRIHLLASLTQVSTDRLKDWFFVRLVLSAAWSIEDHGDPSIALRLASLLMVQ